MLSVSSRIWTRVAVSISYNDNHYTTGTSTQILDMVVYVSLPSDALEKAWYYLFYPSYIDKQLDNLGSLALVRQPVLEKEKLSIQTAVKLFLCRIQLVAEELGQ